MTFEPKELRERISELNDAELLRMVGEEAGEYMPEAIAIAKLEIEARGLADQLPATPGEALDSDAEEVDDELLGDGLKCPACGSGLRPAFLLGETQVIAFFEDNQEQRFVRMHVCPECGTADLFVDFETEVEE
ncbi:MAG: hypothetical protein JSU96_15545 [Acidobacteriota bacterium]|nr:MAG: hypothetical protein JSU96_15545 [Acidobacteriota bacterium]